MERNCETKLWPPLNQKSRRHCLLCWKNSLLEKTQEYFVCTQAFSNRRNGNHSQSTSNSHNRANNNKYCCLCRTPNRPGHNTHYLSQCRFLPEEDRRRLTPGSRIRVIETFEDDSYGDNVENVSKTSRQKTWRKPSVSQ